MFETPECRWRALQMRNPLAASAFLYGVKTTRIYCRPTCPSRLARQANVVFFDSATEAECAGFRACKRCKPSQSDFEPDRAQHRKAVRKACELMDAAGGRLTLETLANSVGLSPRYFHGVFKGLMGVTPSVYAVRVRKDKERHAGPRSEESEEARLGDKGPPLPRNEDNGTTVSGRLCWSFHSTLCCSSSLLTWRSQKRQVGFSVKWSAAEQHLPCSRRC
ncbi:metal binding domain of Ada-domain-containing protein [Parachaetomium inaequale]|uniref:Metal binding domain of Ada-domain-containing protein n=1 Tax=Parachaetomium inaequale TaxID=2588326 RepID=A0AAN6PGR5_9PEZI|nr:metal binding domain of Ada-domain-containing protein [Parachaetomium inaequale]